MPSIYARQLSDRVVMTSPNPDATGLFWGIAWVSMSNISAELLHPRSLIDFSRPKPHRGLRGWPNCAGETRDRAEVAGVWPY